MLEQKQMYNIWLVIICRLRMIQDLKVHDAWGLGYLRAFNLSKGLSPQNHHLESRHGQWQSAVNSWPLRFVPVLNAWWFSDSTAVSWLEILFSLSVFCETEYAYVIEEAIVIVPGWGHVLLTAEVTSLNTTKCWKRCCKDSSHNLSTQTL